MKAMICALLITCSVIHALEKTHHTKAEILISQTTSSGHYVEIKTDHLILRSTKLEDKDFFYHFLYSQPSVIKYDMDGGKLPSEWVSQKVELLVDSWQKGELFSNFTICLKNRDGSCGTPIGLIRVGDREIIGRSLPKGVARMVYLQKKEVQATEYGIEAGAALLYDYIPELIRKNTLLRGEAPLKAVVANVHPDNVPVIEILRDKLKMKQPSTPEEISLYGLPYDPQENRFAFFITAEDLLKHS